MPQAFDSPFMLREMEEKEGFSLKSLLPALRRYWWVMVLAGLAGSGAAVMAFKSVAPRYEAEGAIWIQAESRQDQVSGPITQGSLLESGDQMVLLTSYAVLDPVVIQERLYLNYPPADSLAFRSFTLADRFVPGDYRLVTASDGKSYTLFTDRQMVLEEGQLGDAIGANQGFHWSPAPGSFAPDQEVAFSVVTPRDAARRLATELTTSIDRQGNFIHLSLESSNPVRAANVLNAVMARHVELAAELKRGKLDQLTSILQEQLQNVEGNLRAAEEDLERYKVETVTLPSEESSPIVPGLEQTRGPVFGEFFQLRVEQEEIQRDVTRLREAVSEARAGQLKVESFEMIPSVQNSSQLVAALNQLTEARAELRALRERYTDEYGPVAEVIRRVGDLETVTIPDLAQTLLDEMGTRAAEVTGIVDSRAEELEQIPPRAIEEARRERRYEIANNLYLDVRQRYETASLAAASSIPDVRILDEAVVPRLAAVDQRFQGAAMFFFGALGAGFLLIMLLDRFDPRLRDPADIGHEIGLEWLGAIPRYRRSPTGRDNSEEIREAFRDLRMKIDFAFGATRPMLLSITSPAAAEGKTFVSANLANAFADLGRKTILIDGDTRRGDLHHVLNLDRKPGLTDFLMNGGTHKIIQTTENPNLHFVGFGSRTASSPELLNSSNMQSFLAGLKRRYEVIILDSPPLAAGSDAFILAAHAGSVLTVLRSGSTNKDLAAAKMESFLRLPVRVLGAVLNDFSPQLGQGYYRYYSHYLPGYESSEEEETGAEVGRE